MEISRNFKGKNPGRFTYGGYGIHKKIIQDRVGTSYNNGDRIYNYLGVAYYNGNRLIRLLYFIMERMKHTGDYELDEINMLEQECSDLEEENKRLEEENKKLKEFKTKREESMFYFKAQMERAEPKTAREAEDLQRAKEMFEKLYREELYYLEEENKKLRELKCVPSNLKTVIRIDKENERLEEENKNLKLENAKLKDRIITDENFEEKLDKENKKLKDKIEHLEFDIEAWKKLKAVWEKKELTLEAKDARDDWRAKYYNMEGENKRLKEELDDKEWRLKKLHNQVHFLAGMLYNKGVRIEGCCGRLDIIIEEKTNEEIKPIYGTITNGNTFTYCNANK